MPTDRANAAVSDGGQRILVDPHAQLGTGAWGPFLGLHDRFEQGDGSLFANLAYRWRTTGTYFDGSTYKFGDALLSSLHSQYRVRAPSPRISGSTAAMLGPTKPPRPARQPARLKITVAPCSR